MRQVQPRYYIKVYTIALTTSRYFPVYDINLIFGEIPSSPFIPESSFNWACDKIEFSKDTYLESTFFKHLGSKYKTLNNVRI
mgnify:CR=1 FL=1